MGTLSLSPQGLPARMVYETGSITVESVTPAKPVLAQAQCSPPLMTEVRRLICTNMKLSFPRISMRATELLSESLLEHKQRFHKRKINEVLNDDLAKKAKGTQRRNDKKF
jgi:hypothetical protein